MESFFSKEMHPSISQALSSTVPLKTESTRISLGLSSFAKSVTDPNQCFRAFPDKSVLATKSLRKLKKRLILDLDGTLFAVFGSAPRVPASKITVSVGSGSRTVYVVARKGLVEFFNALAEFYEFQIYTAGYKEFADAVMQEFDIGSYISKVYHREHCFKDETGKYIKDFSLIEADMNTSILLEDADYQSRLQPLNTLIISSFQPDKRDDSDLLDLVPFLTWLSEKEDVRSVKDFFDEYHQSLTKANPIGSIEAFNGIQEVEGQRNRRLKMTLKVDTGKNFNLTLGNIDGNEPPPDRSYIKRMETIKSEKIDIGFSAEVRRKIRQEKATNYEWSSKKKVEGKKANKFLSNY